MHLRGPGCSGHMEHVAGVVGPRSRLAIALANEKPRPEAVGLIGAPMIGQSDIVEAACGPAGRPNSVTGSAFIACSRSVEELVRTGLRNCHTKSSASGTASVPLPGPSPTLPARVAVPERPIHWSGFRRGRIRQAIAGCTSLGATSLVISAATAKSSSPIPTIPA